MHGVGAKTAEAVLAEAGYIEDPEEADDADPVQSEEIVEEFRDFIDSVNPEDFAT